MSILEPLPSSSLLFINYDQQWTSIRYLQECEMVRTDVTSINLRESKHSLYSDISFPGTHYTKGNTQKWLDGGFTFAELIESNFDAFDGNIFIGGNLNYEDPVFSSEYEEVPYGLVRKIVKKPHGSSAEEYRVDSLRSWSIVSKHLSSNLPNGVKYTQSTWEWTIRREFFDHMVSRSTFLLDLALKEAQSRVLPSIAESAAWLELASSWDDKHLSTSPSMKKNLGLAYMNIVRNKESDHFPLVQDIFVGDGGNTNSTRHNWWSGSSTEEGDNWKGWATIRWKEEWGSFLTIESSKFEPGYDQVKSIYESVMQSSRSKANSRG
eukprot:scaffold14715_cov221-Alexandrium_tamarense.AAC.1